MAGDQRPPVLDWAEPFPPVSLEQWRDAVASSLEGRTPDELAIRTDEGLVVRPLYTSDDLPQGWRPAAASRAGWEVCQQVWSRDLVAAADEVRLLQRQGCGAIWLSFDRAARLGAARDAAASDGLQAARVEDLVPVLQALQPGTVLRVNAAGNPVALAGLLFAAVDAAGLDPARLAGSLGCDPLGALAADGELPAELGACLRQMADVAAWVEGNAPRVRAIDVSTLAHHSAGADAVQELAFSLSTAVEYLRALDAAGIEPERSCAQMRLVMAVGRDLFMEVAKLRAARALWADVAGACGGSQDAQVVPIHAVASPRTLTLRDRWVNLLRVTVESFAAVAGGADSLTTQPFDGASDVSSVQARRLAVNTQTILGQEAHLDRVADPGAGSWYVESLSHDLARAAWELFQHLEGRGGMRGCLERGEVAALVAEARERRRQAMASGEMPITGVTSYPAPGEEPERLEANRRQGARSARPRPAGQGCDEALRRLEALVASGGAGGGLTAAAARAAAGGASLVELGERLRGAGPPARVEPLPRQRDSEPFEAVGGVGVDRG